MSFATVLLFGFLLGMKHATEADHLAAVATLATRNDTWRAGLAQGSAWGLGHALTLVLFGGTALLLGEAIPPTMALALEFAVGVMLVFLGADVIRKLSSQKIHFHTHAHEDGSVHLHVHSHADEVAQAAKAREAVPPTFAQFQFSPLLAPAHVRLIHSHPHPARLPGRALLVGMMHGLAGSAALIVLSLNSAPAVVDGVLYILAFGLGSILGMAALTAIITWPLRASAGATSGMHRGLNSAVGLFSLGLGFWLIYRIGVMEKLLIG